MTYSVFFLWDVKPYSIKNHGGSDMQFEKFITVNTDVTLTVAPTDVA